MKKQTLFLLLAMWLGFNLFADKCNTPDERPNIVIFFIDDMGYADIAPFGAEFPTPHLDRLASEGKLLTDFHVSAPVCSASRAALLTGSFHIRVGVNGAYFPTDEVGLNPEETTIAELLRDEGYATACLGKWHLGHHPKFLPPSQGFDYFWGIPYSNDMWPGHPRYAEEGSYHFPPLPILENVAIVDPNVDAADQSLFTHNITLRAVDFIQKHQDDPFFLLLTHPMVHVPLYASDAFEGKTGHGLFADVVNELDWSVGEILRVLEALNLRENTLVLFTSDNGPWGEYGNHAGSAGSLRGWKQNTWEGGVRVPAIVSWPGKIPEGTRSDKLLSTIDLLPTIAALVGAPLPQLPIDGKDISGNLFSEDDSLPSPHESFPFYHLGSDWQGGYLNAIRNERFKLVFAHDYKDIDPSDPGKDGSQGGSRWLSAPKALYDLDADVSEQVDVSSEHPEVVRYLEKEADRYRLLFGDRAIGQTGTAIRPEGVLADSDARFDW